MIPTAAITAWRHHAPWALAEQVEQDLVLSRALIDLFRDPVIAAGLAFRGGTALHKLHLVPAGRYSEDLDFVQVEAAPIGPVLSAIRGALDPWLGRAKYKAGEGRATLLYRYAGEGADAVPMRLKIEINTREHSAVQPIRLVPFAVDSTWCRGEVEIPSRARGARRAAAGRPVGRQRGRMSSMQRPVILFVDIDDTLVRSFGSKRIPMSAMVDSVRALEELRAS